VTQYLTKGRLVLVVGEIEEARAYSDKDGNLRASLEVKAMSVKFLGKPEGSTQSTSNTNTSVNTMIPSNDEDIPF
jgi:single-stranded DNA-binding protein